MKTLDWWRSLALCLLAVMTMAGCNGSPPPAPKTSQNEQSESTGAAAQSSQVNDMLQSAIYHVQPLNIDMDEQAAVSVLNDWIQQSGTFDPKTIGLNEDGVKSVPATWVADDQKPQLTSPNFRVADAVYVRNALLTSSMAKHAAADRQQELDRVVALFDYAMRTVTLQSPSIPQLPFPLNEILLLGQGTSDDRAWAFAALLKQQRIDSVILQSKDDPEARLIGVILDGEVYLFDPRLGLPIPRGEDAPAARITRPATMRDMKEHPDWWQVLTLRADQPYPWTSEQLSAADVFVFTPSESWNARMQQLEKVLPPESSCALYDPLVDTSSQTSLIKRIQAANSDWSPDKIRPWSHPLNVVERVKQLGQQMQQVAILFQRLRVPLVVDRPKKVRQRLTNEEALAEATGRANPFREEAVFEMEGPQKIIPKDELWLARVEMLLGNFGDAIRNLHHVRMLALEAPPQVLPPQELQNWTLMYRLAAIDATYWSAATKFEQDGEAASESSFRDFVKRFAGSNWGSSAEYRLALVLADQGKFAPARAVVAGLSPDDPHRPGLELLEKRWVQLEEKSTPAETKPAETKPDPETKLDNPPDKGSGS